VSGTDHGALLRRRSAATVYACSIVIGACRSCSELGAVARACTALGTETWHSDILAYSCHDHCHLHRRVDRVNYSTCNLHVRYHTRRGSRARRSSSSTISASTRRGSVRRTVPSGVNSWRQLCPAKDASPDDDDDEGVYRAHVPPTTDILWSI